jgi:hypothetical protein
MHAETPLPATKPTPTGTRFGYVLAAAINLALVYVVHNLLTWDVAPFLTNDFDRVAPIITVSLVATAVFNVIYVFYDPAWFKSLTQIGTLAISIAATARMYQVFPFDFSAYDFDWETLAKVVMIIAIVGAGIAIITEFVKLGKAVSRN